MLVVRDLVKRYGAIEAVRGLSFSARGGEILGVVGPNGAGKTSALRCCVGILRPTSGSVEVQGLSLARDELRAKALMAFVPETPNLYPMLSVLEHLRLVALAYRAYGWEDDFLSRARPLLERLDLWELRDRLASDLSKGMRQKTALATAFVHQPEVILLDEPLIGIDPNGVREVRRLLQEARARGAALVVSTHLLEVVERLCDRVLVLERGRAVAEGSVDALRERAQAGVDEDLEAVFFKLLREREAQPEAEPEAVSR
jgi:ABC-2 type transport system ATP-binding protein